MRKLLSANFSRLWKSRLFRIEMMIAVAMAGLHLFVNQFNGAASIKYMDYPFFSQFIYNPVIFAAFITLFLGTEYSDGTLRNKLSIGHSRGSVYAANLCASIILSVAFVFTQILVCLGIGLLVFEPFRMPMEYVAVAAITASMTAITSASIFTAFAMNIQNKAASIIGMVGMSFAVILLVSMIAGVLYAPEMVYEYAEKTATGLNYGPLVPNPGYIRGTARTIAEWINDILPQGQLYSVYSYDFDRYARWPFTSAVVVVVSTVLGYYSFSKKDIK
uniref:ABC transporter permease n=1 Tax=Agathobacter sp. TaxID=2021311 RepID=UPI004057B141